jgi:predicted nucleic acid-binding Zn ribbon protein
MAIRDFMNYLIYVEHAAENLQFYLWYKDYEKRFGEANVSDINLSPEWTQAMEDEAMAKVRREQAEKMKKEPAAAVAIFKGTDFEKNAESKRSNPFNTPPHSANGVSDNDSAWEGVTMNNASNNMLSVSHGTSRDQVAEAFQAAGTMPPCKSEMIQSPIHNPQGAFADYSCPCTVTIQPFHEEVTRIITSYIMDGGSRQLNLSDLYYSPLCFPTSLQDR